jgi:hypothetical protein
VRYSFIFGCDVARIKNWKAEEELRELYLFQKRLGSSGTAVLLLCDTCGGRYLAQDGAGQRRQISCHKELNEDDKEYNRHIAATMVANGIIKDIGQEDVVGKRVRKQDKADKALPRLATRASVDNSALRTAQHAILEAPQVLQPRTSLPMQFSHTNPLSLEDDTAPTAHARGRRRQAGELQLQHSNDATDFTIGTDVASSPRTSATSLHALPPAPPRRGLRDAAAPRTAAIAVASAGWRTVDDAGRRLAVPAAGNRSASMPRFPAAFMRTNDLFGDPDAGMPTGGAPHLRPTQSALMPLSPISILPHSGLAVMRDGDMPPSSVAGRLQARAVFTNQ